MIKCLFCKYRLVLLQNKITFDKLLQARKLSDIIAIVRLIC